MKSLVNYILFGRRMERIEKLLLSNTDNIRNTLETALTELVSDKKEGSLVISFLRSSYISNSHEFYIAYYEDDLFVRGKKHIQAVKTLRISFALYRRII